jgi:hypothetical protein
MVVSTVVEIDEQLPVGGQLFIQPGALLGGQVLEKLLSRDAPGLAHEEQDIGLHLNRTDQERSARGQGRSAD